MKNWLIGTVIVALAATMAPTDSEAKRLGGGRSTGLQRDMPARTAPDAVPAKPATPAQGTSQAPTQQTTAGAAATAPGAAAAAGKRSWLGPIAGLAAGLGLAALMSHLGLGEAFGEFLLLALIVLAAVALVAFVRRRWTGGAGRTPALAATGAAATSPSQVAWPVPARAGAEDASTVQRRSSLDTLDAPVAIGPAAAAGAPAGRALVPASFDAESFERIARAIFIRMQAANDSADLDDLRRFTTPEMFASLKVDLLDRGGHAQSTEVRRVDARVVDVADDAERQIVSVRYRGELVEAAGEAPVAFDEVWHLVKPRDADAGWAIAGIEQIA